MDKEKRNELVVKFIKFLQEKYDDIKIEGVLIFGSVLNDGNFGKRSDIDIYVLIKNNGNRYRGVQLINNVEFDYFVNPIEQLQKYFKNVHKMPTSARMTILDMLAGGEIIQDDNNELLDLKKEAKDILKQEIATKMTETQKKMAVYFINDYLKDIKDSFDIGDEFAWQQNVNLLLNYLVDTFCSLKQIQKVKPKYQKTVIQEVDSNFVEMYKNITKSQLQLEQQEVIEKLVKYVIEEIEIENEKDWEIITDIKI